MDQVLGGSSAFKDTIKLDIHWGDDGRFVGGTYLVVSGSSLWCLDQNRKPISVHKKAVLIDSGRPSGGYIGSHADE